MRAWRLGRGLAVGAGRRRLEAMLLGQPAEPEEGELGGQFSLEGADAGSQGAQGIHMGFTSFYWKFTWESYLTAGEPKFLVSLSFPLISGHFHPSKSSGAVGSPRRTPVDTGFRRYDGRTGLETISKTDGTFRNHLFWRQLTRRDPPPS